MREFTKLQPKPGDVILMCPHSESHKGHWFNFLGGVKRTDLKTHETEHISMANWIYICEHCFVKYDNPIEAVDHDIVWQKSKPVIHKSRQ